MDHQLRFLAPVSFDWNEGNKEKNWIKHQVTTKEAEQVFFNNPKIIWKDDKHSTSEKRYIMLGKTNIKRRLHIVYVVREEKIRVISAQDQNKKERRLYENQR